MDVKTSYEYFKALRTDIHTLIYRGAFSDDITDMITNLIETHINEESKFAKVRNKVSFLMVESFQNIVRHSDETELNDFADNTGLFVIRNIGTKYYISSANLVENDKVRELKDKLEHLNELDKESLKALYIDVLNNKGLSEKGGAGLGLIEMARKSGQKLDFDFVNYNEKYSHFYFQMKMKGKKVEDNEVTLEIPIALTQQFHQRAKEENIFLIHKGNFNQDAIKPVIKMVENNVLKSGNTLKRQKTAIHVLVEILQNISKHAYPKKDNREGIFLVGEIDNEYVFNVGNLINNEKKDNLRAQIELVNSLSVEELHGLYRQKLLLGEETENGGAGLGLIDIARETKNKLIFDFIEVDKDMSFFSLIVKL